MAGSWNSTHTEYDGDDSGDVATGTALNENMFGNQGDDVLNGGAGNDDIDGGVGSDNLQGGDGNDFLWDFTGVPSGFSGIIGHDTLNGGAGDDHVNVWSPDTGDVADGGTGTDEVEIRFNYETVSDTHAISFTLGAGGATSIAQVDGINTVTVSNFDNMLFVCNDGNDFITGADGNDTIAGQGGNDVLKGMGGDDSLNGGSGVQDIDGGVGNDSASFDVSFMTGGVTVSNSANLSLGAGGTIKNIESFGFIVTGSGNDRVTLTQQLTASISTGGGNDDVDVSASVASGINTGAGDDKITGSAYGDIVDGGAGSDVVHLGAGYDAFGSIYNNRLDTGADKVWGEDGNDYLALNAGADRVDGGIGDDTVYAGQGADTVNGGDGNDYIRSEGGGDYVDGGAGNDKIELDRDYSLYASPIDNDHGIGGDGNDTIVGGIGADTLDGGDGNDTLTLGLVRDDGTLDTMMDVVLGRGGQDTLAVYGTQGSDTTDFSVHVGATIDVRANGALVVHATLVEAFTGYFSGAGDITVVGGKLADFVYAGSGAGSFDMGKGNDYAYAAGGADTVDGGKGNDTVAAGTGGADSMDLGAGNDSLTLSDYYAGSEVSTPGGVYDGGDGTDTLNVTMYNANSSFDGVHIRYGAVVVGTVENFEAISFYGSTGGYGFIGTAVADTITLTDADGDLVSGLAGADTIAGGSGADTLIGGADADRLTGGGGNDVFKYTALADSAGAAIDTITDFTTGDRIDLSAIDASTEAAGNQSFVIGSAGDARHITIAYDAAHFRTEIDLYVDKNASIDGTIYLSGDHSSLTLADFVA